MDTKKKVIGIIIVIVAVILAITLVKNNKNNNKAATKQTIEVKRTSVDKSELPEKFPSNFPTEKNADLLENANLLFGEGAGQIKQGIRQFVSGKTLAENFKLYNQYITDNKWTLISSVNEENIKSLTAVKGQESLTIVLSKNAKGGTLVNTTLEYK